MMKAGREAVVGGRYGGVVAYAVGGSFFVFCFWCGRVVGHRLVFLFCSFLIVVFGGAPSACLGGGRFRVCCGMVGVPLLVFIGCPCWFVLLVGVFCVGCFVGGVGGIVGGDSLLFLRVVSCGWL
jgi:hypothetical protein